MDFCVCPHHAFDERMTTFILTWNPANWEWQDLKATIARARVGEDIVERWSSGNTKRIPVGSRVFLLKQGKDPRGLMASGWTTAEVDELPHWDTVRSRRGDLANYVDFAVDTLLDPGSDELLDPRDFPPGPVRDAYWTPPASGTSIPPAVAMHLESLWEKHTSGASSVGATDQELTGLEGKLRTRLVKHRSRERALRDAKIQEAQASGPLRCEVPGCAFDFAQRYGSLGRGYAQVHHLRPLSLSKGPIETRLSDLAIVCANCHAMIHLGGACRPLRSLVKQRRV